MGSYYVYILTNRPRGVLYTGVTSDPARRLYLHRSGLTAGFAQQYNLDRLVYIEVVGDAYTAISREKQIKGWVRRKKVRLIEDANPDWRDLSLDW